MFLCHFFTPGSYEAIHSCWESEPNLRPDFRDLLDTLNCLLSELPVLEADQEATYINQGLDVDVAASEDPQTNSVGRLENEYLPLPVGVAGSGNSRNPNKEHPPLSS